MYCKHCGKEIAENSTFCQHCGKEEENNSQKRSKIKSVWIIYFIWALFQTTIVAFLCHWNKLGYCFLVLILILLLILVYRFVKASIGCFYDVANYKSDNASAIKNVLGFDFGDDYKLLHTGTQEHEVYLYIFSEKSFEPLKKHLESIPDGKDNVTGRVVYHCFKGQRGTDFRLVEDRRDNYGCGNIESIEVDYKERTLKYVFVIF